MNHWASSGYKTQNLTSKFHCSTKGYVVFIHVGGLLFPNGSLLKWIPRTTNKQHWRVCPTLASLCANCREDFEWNSQLVIHHSPTQVTRDSSENPVPYNVENAEKRITFVSSLLDALSWDSWLSINAESLFFDGEETTTVTFKEIIETVRGELQTFITNWHEAVVFVNCSVMSCIIVGRVSRKSQPSRNKLVIRLSN